MAKRLAAEENSFLIDNYYFHDFIKPFIGPHSGAGYWNNISKMRSGFIKILAAFYPENRPVRYIFTEVVTDPDRDLKFVEELAELARSIGGEFFPIGLYSDLDALKSRCTAEERKKRGKMCDPEKYTMIYGDNCDFKPLEFYHPNRLVIDSSKLTEDETFWKIKMHIA